MFLSVVSAVALLPDWACAQRSEKLIRIGFLGLPRSDQWNPKVEALIAGLREHGYVEGRNLVIDYRWAEGQYDRLPVLAKQLLEGRPDVLISHATPGIAALKAVTTTVPIVIAATGDAVASGLVSNLARPGGNITGSTFFSPELLSKRLELIKEAFPDRRRVGLLVNSRTFGMHSRDLAEQTASRVKIALLEFPISLGSDIEASFEEMAKQRVTLVVVAEDPMVVGNTSAIISSARKRKLPVVGYLEIAESGGGHGLWG